MNPAYYVTDLQWWPGTAGRGLGWVQEPVGLSADAKKELTELGHYEPPGPFGEPSECFALLDTKHSGRALCVTRVPRANRSGEYWSRFLTDISRKHSLLDLMVGCWGKFWHPELDRPESDWSQKLVIPSIDRWGPFRSTADDKFRSWLNHGQLLFEEVLGAYCRLMASGKLYIADDPKNVLECVYGLARLLPRTWTEDLTFSTYTKAPLHCPARIVGTCWRDKQGSLPSTCSAQPNIAIDTLSTSKPQPPLGKDVNDYLSWILPLLKNSQFPEIVESATASRFDFKQLLLELKGEATKKAANHQPPMAETRPKDRAKPAPQSVEAIEAACKIDPTKFRSFVDNTAKSDQLQILVKIAVSNATQAIEAQQPSGVIHAFEHYLGKLPSKERVGALDDVMRGSTGVSDVPVLRALIESFYAHDPLDAFARVKDLRNLHEHKDAWRKMLSEPLLFKKTDLIVKLCASADPLPVGVIDSLIKDTNEGKLFLNKMLACARDDAKVATSLATAAVGHETIQEKERIEFLVALLDAAPSHKREILSAALEGGDLAVASSRWVPDVLEKWGIREGDLAVKFATGLLAGPLSDKDWPLAVKLLDSLGPGAEDQMTGRPRMRWDALKAIREWGKAPSLRSTDEWSKLKNAVIVLKEWVPERSLWDDTRDKLRAAIRKEYNELGNNEFDAFVDDVAACLREFAASFLGGKAEACKAIMAEVVDEGNMSIRPELVITLSWLAAQDRDYQKVVKEFRRQLLRSPENGRSLLAECDKKMLSQTWLGLDQGLRESVITEPITDLPAPTSDFPREAGHALPGPKPDATAPKTTLLPQTQVHPQPQQVPGGAMTLRERIGGIIEKGILLSNLIIGIIILVIIVLIFKKI